VSNQRFDRKLRKINRNYRCYVEVECVQITHRKTDTEWWAHTRFAAPLGEERVCGKGRKPEEALDDLERRLAGLELCYAEEEGNDT
jgi:hypothetical protein